MFVVAAWFSGPSWALPALLYLVAVGVALAFIDVDVRRLPDVIVLPSYLAFGVRLALASWNPGGESEWQATLRALAGGAAMFAAYFALLLVFPAGMGFGDVKLAGALGLCLGWFGWGSLTFGFFAAFLLGGVYALTLLATRRAGRKSGIPFGPWMVLGAFAGVVTGEAVSSWYVGLL